MAYSNSREINLAFALDSSNEDYFGADNTLRPRSKPSAREATTRELSGELSEALQIISSGLRLAGRLVNGRRESAASKFAPEVERALARANELVLMAGTLFVHDRAPLRLDEILFQLRRPIGAILEPAVSLSITVPPNLPAVRCNPVEFEFMLLNLVLTAREAMRVGDQIALRASRVRYSAESPGVILRASHAADPMAQFRAKSSAPSELVNTRHRPANLAFGNVRELARQLGGGAFIEHSSARGRILAFYLPGANLERRDPHATWGTW